MAHPAPAIQITDEFARALRGMGKSARHLLITGSAGTGKSTLLSYFCGKVEWDPVVLAPTGVAALNVGGQTVHRFFGFGIDVTPESVAARRRKPRNPGLYKSLRTLIIDEVSMLRADLLDCVDTFLKLHGPQPGAPFGGVHMVFIGDLYQLPPVVTGLERQALRQVYASPHFFCARALSDVELEMIELTRVFRQRDRDFVELLNRIRKNTLEPGDLDLLNQRKDPYFEPPEGEGYITLTGTNRRASSINQLRLDGLAAPQHLFEAVVHGDFSREYYPTEAKLAFKVGAQIMLLNNDGAQRWVNGSIGEIEDVHIGGGEEYIVVRLADSGRRARVEPYEWELIRFEAVDGRITASPAGTFTQFPFRLAWAVTVHKSQGKTFDRMVIDLDRVFAAGQTYVALSRCTSIEGLVLTRPLTAKSIRSDWRVQQFLTGEQYRRAEEALSTETKIRIIEDAIDEGSELDIEYLKRNDVRTHRRVRPLEVGTHSYSSREFLGMRAWCMLRDDERMFRVDRILSLNFPEN